MLLSSAWSAGANQATAEGLRWIANAVLPGHVFWQLREIAPTANGGWMLRTWLEIVGSGAQEHALILLDAATPSYVLRGLPMTLALVMATSGFRPGRLMGALATYGVVALLALAGVITGQFAVLIDHQPSMVDDRLLPPPYRVHAGPLSSIEFYLACYADYLGRLVLPIATPMAIWVSLCSKELLRLWALIRRRRHS